MRQTQTRNSQLCDLANLKGAISLNWSKMNKHIAINSSSALITLLGCIYLIAPNDHCLVSSQQLQYQTPQPANSSNSFPGVAQDLGSFCAGRPSLPVDVASMIVHTKRNNSFNYKLYLFSADNVLQTGQVIPRDDFRIHAFPVKLKRLNEFWPASVTTYRFNGPSIKTLTKIPSETFKIRHFLRSVPLNSQPSKTRQAKKLHTFANEPPRHQLSNREDAPEADTLPGDASFISHDVARVLEVRASAGLENFNRHIDFDRDDQVSSVSREAFRSSSGTDYLAGLSKDAKMHTDLPEGDASILMEANLQQELRGQDQIVPVGSFSSFHVNLTYLVRKDFGQLEPELIQFQVDAAQFQVNQVVLISNGTQSSASYPQNEDYEFLSHKLLRDGNTRITAIDQIYEDWITRNLYTVVYIQRRLDEFNQDNEQTVVKDRLIFRGSSSALLGADQLDYSVKAAAFITEKNGLHYYLEFLPTNKFYLGAIDWTKRPFKIFDSRRFSIKPTRTQLDNEELLLCPPAVCYSSEPIDEIVGYGRINLNDKIQHEATILSTSLSASTPNFGLKTALNKKGLPVILMSASQVNETALIYSTNRTVPQTISGRLTERQVDYFGRETTSSPPQESISLDSVIEALRLGSNQLQARLHLRDWVWILSRQPVTPISEQRSQRLISKQESGADSNRTNSSRISWAAKFELRYELARRNDIKVKPDTYGYVLTGHEIDASYRVYNELYLISANHLITINYTMANETVVSTHPIGDEFFGLSSLLIDPITGAFYDRYTNQLYFFKGDRYVGYDYATKKPLEDFLLESTQSAASEAESAPLVSSMPVVEILGRQHQVDGIYHDFITDLVHIFTGMKFYTFEAAEFKNGSFKPETGSLPPMRCINEHFLHGCNFDEAFRNPCQSDSELAAKFSKLNSLPNQHADESAGGKQITTTTTAAAGRDMESGNNNNRERESASPPLINFHDEQQMKLRSIASRPSLLSILVDRSLLGSDAARALEPLISANGIGTLDSAGTRPQEKIIFYLLTSMIMLTGLVTLVVIVVIINWTKMRMASSQQQHQQSAGTPGARTGDDPQTVSNVGARLSATSVAFHRQQQQQLNEPATRSHYLSNQQHHSRRHPYHAHSGSAARDPLSNLGRASLVKPLGSASVVVSKGRRQSGATNTVVDSSVL